MPNYSTRAAPSGWEPHKYQNIICSSSTAPVPQLPSSTAQSPLGPAEMDPCLPTPLQQGSSTGRPCGTQGRLSLSPAFPAPQGPVHLLAGQWLKAVRFPQVFANTCTGQWLLLSWHRQMALSLLCDTQGTPGLSQTCTGHLSPPQGTARNSPQPGTRPRAPAGAKVPLEEAVTMVRGQRLISLKETLGGDRRAAKVMACHLKKTWQSTNWG